MIHDQLQELLYQALETELGGIEVYKTAICCAVNGDLKKEWEESLAQTRSHEEVLQTLMSGLELDPGTETPGRAVVRHIGESLVEAMELALESDTPSAAQRVATECVVLAETKDHQNWELIGEYATNATGSLKIALETAYDEVEDDEDEHLYRSIDWSRELWIESLGLPAILPPPDEEQR